MLSEPHGRAAATSCRLYDDGYMVNGEGLASSRVNTTEATLVKVQTHTEITSLTLQEVGHFFVLSLASVEICSEAKRHTTDVCTTQNGHIAGIWSRHALCSYWAGLDQYLNMLGFVVHELSKTSIDGVAQGNH